MSVSRCYRHRPLWYLDGVRADEWKRRLRRSNAKRLRLKALWREATRDFALLNEAAVADEESGLTFTAIAEDLGMNKETIRQMRQSVHRASEEAAG